MGLIAGWFYGGVVVMLRCFVLNAFYTHTLKNFLGFQL